MLLVLALSLAVVGCSRGNAAELLETAKFEEVQRNVPHARKLYQDILTHHPTSPEAAVARERLAALGPGPASE